MRAILIAAILGASASWTPALSADAAATRLTAAMETCLKSNASSVDQAEPSLFDGANFLIMELCAREVATRQSYLNNTKLLDELRQSANAPVDDRFSRTAEDKLQLEKARADTIAAYAVAFVDPITGELVTPQKPPRSFTSLDPAMTQIFTRTMDQAGIAPADVRAFAARALLDARMARMKTGTPR